ncbi:uncharacterized protein LOC117173064 [Belonocnema kinseyi]|uniref:uncharacterized protein LOC117173064 n=1 Tax=Belonocnema kinseyi TaxID=2817044 RepID=UPI00143CE3DE|nr:uncharacterized protein LOC117173064 [Belonocnema kinseyi]
MEEAEDVNEIQIAEKAWQKSVESAKKIGFREGIDAGSDSVLQEGFDTGYAEAFKIAFALGVYKALATALPEEVKIPQEIQDILSMTRRGACVLCKTEPQIQSRKKSKEESESSEKSLEDVIKSQREHSVHTIQTLYEYFEPLFKKYELDVEDLPRPDRDL